MRQLRASAMATRTAVFAVDVAMRTPPLAYPDVDFSGGCEGSARAGPIPCESIHAKPALTLERKGRAAPFQEADPMPSSIFVSSDGFPRRGDPRSVLPARASEGGAAGHLARVLPARLHDRRPGRRAHTAGDSCPG